tara:strand:+ start:3580 stop:3912 length:333 start_codon:yes stop_codon:yes gene_type:complete
MRYEEAIALMKTAKNPSKGKPLLNNTRLHSCLDGSFEIKLHGHPIITIHPNHITLDSCGYKTVTTKARMNTFTPLGFKVIQRKWNWMVVVNGTDEYDFYDGIKFSTEVTA